jgi:hypothetical protein
MPRIVSWIRQRRYGDSLHPRPYGTGYFCGINTNSDEFSKTMVEAFKNSDVVLSAMDRSSVMLAEKLKVSTIWLDTLFWWYDEIPGYMLNVDCYIKQNTLNDEKNCNKYAGKIKNLHSVGPIVDLSPLKKINKANQVVVAYGGMEAEGIFKVGVDSHYPYIVTDLLINRVDFSNYEKILFTGNERVIKELDAKYGNEKFIFKALPHNTFIQELANSQISLMVPGLETPLEAFSYRIPTIFLPPSNSSQYVQLDDFINRGAATMSVHFTDYYPRLNFEGKNLGEMLQIFLEQLHIFEKDGIVQSDVAKKVNNFIHSKELYDTQIVAQEKFIDMLGGNGTEKCLKIISDFIENRANNSLIESKA